MKTIDKNRQRMIQEEIDYKEEMQRNITQAIDTMSAKSLVKLIDSLNKVDDIYSNKLTEKQKEYFGCCIWMELRKRARCIY